VLLKPDILTCYEQNRPEIRDFACAGCHTVLVSPFAMSRVGQLLAYADPGSGLLIWQGLLAAFFGCLFYLRRILKRLKKRANTRAEERGERGDGASAG